jgi:hypothetical protein
VRKAARVVLVGVVALLGWALSSVPAAYASDDPGACVSSSYGVPVFAGEIDWPGGTFDVSGTGGAAPASSFVERDVYLSVDACGATMDGHAFPYNPYDCAQSMSGLGPAPGEVTWGSYDGTWGSGCGNSPDVPAGHYFAYSYASGCLGTLGWNGPAYDGSYYGSCVYDGVDHYGGLTLAQVGGGPWVIGGVNNAQAFSGGGSSSGGSAGPPAASDAILTVAAASSQGVVDTTVQLLPYVVPVLLLAFGYGMTRSFAGTRSKAPK